MSAILEGKAAVVTGGGRGIGKGHCLQLAKNGAMVVGNDIDLEEAEKGVAEIKELGAKATACKADITSIEGAETLVAHCVKEFGKIDIMVNNAGIAKDRTFMKMTIDEFDAVMNVHVRGTFCCAQAAAKSMKETGTEGVIINTASAAQFGNFGQTNYSAAKGAITSMTFTMAMELSRYGIRVNAVSPAGTTRMSDTFKGADGKLHKMPFIDPELNGPMLAYICSDEGKYITGQVFGIGANRVWLLDHPKYSVGMLKDGGWSLEDIKKNFKKAIGNRLESLGIQKAPYPYYDGVKAKPKKS